MISIVKYTHSRKDRLNDTRDGCLSIPTESGDEDAHMQNITLGMSIVMLKVERKPDLEGVEV